MSSFVYSQAGCSDGSFSLYHTKSGKCQKAVVLTFITLWANLANDKELIVFLFFPENKVGHFMHIVSLGDNLHEILKLIFWGKIRKKFQNVSCNF